MKLRVKISLIFLLLLGAVLRLIPYFLNHSLSLDEASLAVNITDRGFLGLLHPLIYQQVAPVLFLWIEKATILLLGNSEQSLRLQPLLCGLLCLPLIYRLTKTLSGNITAGLIALFLFATSTVLIDYANEVKQYEGDVFCALCLLNLVFDASFTANNKRFIVLALAGSVSFFLSNVTVLVVFSICIYYLFTYRVTVFKKPLLLLMFACWGISFMVYYLLFISHHPLRAFMVNYWQFAFMPLHVFSAGYWVWMYGKFLSLFKFYSLPFLAVFILSAILFIVKRQWLFLFLLLFPLALHFMVSGLKLYPYETRLMLYLMAFITPVIAIGIVELIPVFTRLITGYGTAVLLMLLVYSLIAQLVNTHYPFSKEEIKQSIDCINLNKVSGQKIYVYEGANHAANYYLRLQRISPKENLIWGTANWNGNKNENCYNDICKLNGYVWLLFSSVYPADESCIINRITQSHIPILKTFKNNGSSAYLIILNGSTHPE